MKRVLLVDNHQLFRDFLKQKLSSDKIEVLLTQEKRDSYTRMVSSLPDLVIYDMDDDNKKQDIEFFEKKMSDPNTSTIPILATGPTEEKAKVASLAKYGIIKYFAKPIQFDVFFESISKELHIPLSMDLTPCVLDLHRNADLIIIELALGLNREKIALLQYKLAELIEKEDLSNPKIVVMLTNLDLTFVDGYNLEFLIESIISAPKVHKKNFKILSTSKFLRELIAGHKQYTGIEVAANLPRVINSLVDSSMADTVSEIITSKILTPTSTQEEASTVETRFFSDSLVARTKRKDGVVLHIALVDADTQILDEEEQAFSEIGASVKKYVSGKDFLFEYEDDKFDLVIVDALIPDNSGLRLLQELKENPRAPTVIVYSQSLQKDVVVRVLSLGAKSYIVKPQKPNVLVQKSLAILKG